MKYFANVTPTKTMLAAVFGALFLLSPTPSEAMSPRLADCDPGTFRRAKGEHRVFVAWFPATWCPTCRRQRETLTKLAKQGMEGNPYICAFDFDAAEALRDELGVAAQSSLVRYEGGRETGRSVGETKPERLRPFLEGR